MVTTLVGLAMLLALAGLTFVALTGCTWLKGEAADVKSAVVDCTKTEAAKVVTQLGPLAEVALIQAIDPDSKVQWRPLETLFKDATADVAGCALAAAVQKLLIPPQPQVGAPKSEPVTVDRAALLGSWRAFSVGHFGGAVFHTESGDI